MPKNIIETVLQLTGKKDNDLVRLRIEAIYNEILSYLNREEATDEMFPIICTCIADCINNGSNSGSIQSFSEGDLSISYSTTSPFFGKLDSFKLIKGIGECSEKTD